jgi:hypothetical protein
MAIEATGLAITAAAIALGLNQQEAMEFNDRAYAKVRGASAWLRYELLIELAYEIKNEKRE